MSRAARPDRFGDVLRVVVVAVIAAAPWAFGSVHPPFYLPLLGVAAVTGMASWARGHWRRAHGQPQPKVPGARLLLGLHALVVFQLVPLPAVLLRGVSPGSATYYDFVTLGGVRFAPIAVSVPDTARALAFLAGFSLLYAFAFRELEEPAWRRRAAMAVVASAALMTLEALVQARSADPERLLGIYKPEWFLGVVGPYVNKNHFAGYLALALPIAAAWMMEAWPELRRIWTRRRLGWLALGDAPGTSLLRRAAVVVTLVVGLAISRSRGGLLAALVAVLGAPLLVRQKRLALSVLAVVATALAVSTDPGELQRGAASGWGDVRRLIWPDALRMFPDFPVFGAGMNGFGLIYMRYRGLHGTWLRNHWVGEAHNDYLQALLDLGLLGLALVVCLVVLLLGRAARGARAGGLGIGLLGSLLASCTHAFVDFNWQIPANAATFALLAGLGVQEPRGSGARSE